MISYKNFSFFKTVFLLGILSLYFVPPTWAKLNVVGTTENLAALAKEVGQNLAVVKSIARGYQDPHHVDPKPSYMVMVNRADLLLYHGLDLESAWLPQLIEGSRNRQIRFGQIGHLDLSQSVDQILEIPFGVVDRSMGDVHPFGNPHYTMDPLNGIRIAHSIAERMSILDPENESLYKSNAGAFETKVNTKLKQWENRLRKFSDKKIVTYHRNWSYFFARFGLQYLGNVEIRPGILPSPRHLADLAVEMKRQHSNLIINTNYFPTKWSDLLAQKTNARVVVLPAMVNGIPEARDYISFIEYLVNRYEQELSKSP